CGLAKIARTRNGGYAPSRSMRPNRKIKKHLSYHEQALRDLARLDRGEHAPIEIKMRRMVTEERLATLMHALFRRSPDAVRCLVFEGDPANYRTYLSTMLTWLGHDSIATVDEEELQVIQDAWNYFPHRNLDGRCPAEFMFGSTNAENIIEG